jgi:hypothetical protein
MDWMVDALLEGLVAWLSKALLATLKALWGLLEQTVFTSPDVTVLPQVATISGRSQAIVNAAFVVAVIAAGATVMTHETVQVRYGVSELLPRLVVGFVAANFATPICRNLTTAANTVTGAITGDGVAAKGSFQQMQRVVTDALNNDSAAFMLVIIGLIITVLTGMLLVTYIVRVGVLLVLVAIAPVALACHATPFTEPVAKLWWRSILGVLATVMLQALAMHAALSVFLDPGANVAALGIPHDPMGIGNLFIVACLLWVVVKIPGLMRRYVTRGSGPGGAGLFLRMIVIQAVTKMARLPFGRGASRAAAAGAHGRQAATARVAGEPSAANTVIPYLRPRAPRPTPAGTAAPRPSPATNATPPSAGGHAATTASAAGTASSSANPSVDASTGTSLRPRVPAGTTPATAMPPRRPAWQAYQKRPSGTGWPTAPRSTSPAPRSDGRPATPPTVRPSGTGWAATRIRPAGVPRHPATRTPRTGGTGGR